MYIVLRLFVLRLIRPQKQTSRSIVRTFSMVLCGPEYTRIKGSRRNEQKLLNGKALAEGGNRGEKQANEKRRISFSQARSRKRQRHGASSALCPRRRKDTKQRVLQPSFGQDAGAVLLPQRRHNEARPSCPARFAHSAHRRRRARARSRPHRSDFARARYGAHSFRARGRGDPRRLAVRLLGL